MKREPSVHITKEKLTLVLENLLESNNIVTRVSYEKLAYQFLLLSRPYSISNRTVNVTCDRLEKKVKKLLSSSTQDSDLFAKLLFYVRQSLKHKGIAPIRAGSKDWDSLKYITSQAINFCNDFNLSKQEGFKAYITIGLKKMRKYGLQKFNGIHSAIAETYQAMEELKGDVEPDATWELYRYYTGYIAKKTGIVNEYKDNPDKYVCFKRVREEAERLRVDGIEYIRAQFAGLDFAGGIPDPLQLVGEKAIERLNRYLFKNGVKMDNDFKLDINKIKGA